MSTQKLHPFIVATWLWMRSWSSSSSGRPFSSPQYMASCVGTARGSLVKITFQGVRFFPNCRWLTQPTSRMTRPPGFSMGVTRMGTSCVGAVVVGAAEAVVHEGQRGEDQAEQDAERDASDCPHRTVLLERAAAAVSTTRSSAGP